MPCWVKLFFWWGILMKPPLLGGPSFSPLFSKIFSKRVSMCKRKLSCIIRLTSPPWSSPILEDYFWMAKEVHLVILQALIEVWSPSGSLVVDLSLSIGLFPFLSKTPLDSLYSHSNFKWHFPCKKQHQSLPNLKSPHTNLGVGCGCLWSGLEVFGSWYHPWVQTTCCPIGRWKLSTIEMHQL